MGLQRGAQIKSYAIKMVIPYSLTQFVLQIRSLFSPKWQILFQV